MFSCFMNHHKYSSIFVITLIVIIASLFRLYNINHRGILTYDESQLLLEAQYNNSVFVWSKKYLTTIITSPQKALDTENLVKEFYSAGSIPRTGRVIHTFLLSLGDFYDSTGVTTGLVMMALFGTGCVVLTFYLGLHLTKSVTIASLSALILAVLPYHIIYSRSLISETDAQFFFLISLITYLKYLKSKQSFFYFLTALLIGFCFITNGDRIAFFAIPLLDLAIHIKKWLKSLLIFCTGFIIPVLLAELPYYLAFLLTHNLGIIMTNPTYLEQQLWAHTRLSRFGYETSLFSIFTYPYALLVFGGVVFTFTLTVGLIKTISLKDKRFWVILTPIALTLLFQSIYSLKVLRALIQILPLLAICAAIGADAIFKKMRKVVRPNLLIIIFFALLFIESVYRTYPVLIYNNRSEQAVNFVGSKISAKILATNALALKVYLPNKHITPYQNVFLAAKGEAIDFTAYDYLITTPQKYTIASEGRFLTTTLDPNLKLIEKSCLPIQVVSEQLPKTLLYLFAFDHNANLKKSLDFINSFDYNKDFQTKIYDLNRCQEVLNQKKDEKSEN